MNGSGKTVLSGLISRNCKALCLTERFPSEWLKYLTRTIYEVIIIEGADDLDEKSTSLFLNKIENDSHYHNCIVIFIIQSKIPNFLLRIKDLRLITIYNIAN